MSKCYKYKDNQYEIFVEEYVFIKDIENNVYLKNEINNLPKSISSSLIEYIPKVHGLSFILFVFLFVFLLISNLILLNYADVSIQAIPISDYLAYLFLVGYLLFNIFTHEMGHIKALNYMGRKHQKVGFKLNYYVFPAVYVEMNEVYLLSKTEKIVVHLAGLVTNYMIINLFQIVNLLFFSSKTIDSAFIFFSYALLWNLLPILNSDGYKVLITLFNIDELDNKRKNHMIVKTIQGISILLAVWTVISWFL
ncbi:hypothetical protein [Candidatus Enterococcus ikei]|uniref:hypothetical protein n=1 Tax=Candidatus Enterococcus ikei TaxID=2815326 RepID=UPI001F5D3744|nr:hypothetical protein [Enterococcus sp. DIV0869a]